MERKGSSGKFPVGPKLTVPFSEIMVSSICYPFFVFYSIILAVGSSSLLLVGLAFSRPRAAWDWSPRTPLLSQMSVVSKGLHTIRK